tara:strand:- start:75 stop:563 length:489 start_codon:yes stop_codon:yes gene_type:complete
MTTLAALTAAIETTRNDVAALAELPGALADFALSTARALLAELTAELDAMNAAAAETVRVRGLTAAQAAWIANPTLGAGAVYALTATGRTWIEGTRAQLAGALDAAWMAGEGMVASEIQFAAEDEAASLPEHLQDSYVTRRVARSLACIRAAAVKVRAALAQ